MAKTTKFSRNGFGVVELLIISGVIALFSIMLLPRFQQFQARAKMGEARNTLSQIYTLQQAHQFKHKEYVNMPQRYGRLADGDVQCDPPAGAISLGFQIYPCKDRAAPVPRYGYEVTLQGSSNRSGFIATAYSGEGEHNLVCQGKAAHFIQVNQDKVFTESNQNNAFATCFQ